MAVTEEPNNNSRNLFSFNSARDPLNRSNPLTRSFNPAYMTSSKLDSQKVEENLGSTQKAMQSYEADFPHESNFNSVAYKTISQPYSFSAAYPPEN